eukprot:750532-Hanusia_phi.AAC.1
MAAHPVCGAGGEEGNGRRRRREGTKQEGNKLRTETNGSQAPKDARDMMGTNDSMSNFFVKLKSMGEKGISGMNNLISGMKKKESPKKDLGSYVPPQLPEEQGDCAAIMSYKPGESQVVCPSCNVTNQTPTGARSNLCDLYLDH